MKEFEEIIRSFQIEGDITEVRPLGHGMVNVTYEVACGGKSYVLQEINRDAFPYPTEVMNNLFLVTEYLRDAIGKEGRDPSVETLTFIRTREENQLLQTGDGRYFRLYHMISRAEEMKRPKTPETTYEVGKIIGQFHRRLRDFDTGKLFHTIPKLHNMENVRKAFLDAVRADMCLRASECRDQIRFVLDRSKGLNRIRDAARSGDIPLRVTHNDAKFANILVDAFSKKAICLIDLDTVMPGISIYDFGDSVRAGVTAPDGEGADDDNNLDLEMYRFHLQGYVDEMGRVLVPGEKELINYAVWLMALECGIRRLTDHLTGRQDAADDSDECRGLRGAVSQFDLVSDIEGKMEQMDEVAKEVFMYH